MSETDEALADAMAERTYRAIGRFIFEFSQAEWRIRTVLASEIGLKDEFFSIVIESYDVAMLCNVAKAVFAKSRSQTNAAKIIALINDFFDLNLHRNRVAHGVWVPFREGGIVHNVPRTSLKPVAYSNQAASLEKLADNASSLRFRLEEACWFGGSGRKRAPATQLRLTEGPR